MSISLGLYDVFANTVPGLLYFVTLYEFLRLLGWKSIDLTTIDTWGQIVLVVLVSFVLGNIIGAMSFRYWFKLFYKIHSGELALTRLRRSHPNIKFEFVPDDGEIAFAVIAHHDKALAEKIETKRVNSIMMRNISLGLFLYGLLQVAFFITQHNSLSLLTAVSSWIFSIIALRRAATFDRWFLQDVFREIVNYGGNIRDVINVSRRITLGNESRKKEK